MITNTTVNRLLRPISQAVIRLNVYLCHQSFKIGIGLRNQKNDVFGEICLEFLRIPNFLVKMLTSVRLNKVYCARRFYRSTYKTAEVRGRLIDMGRSGRSRQANVVQQSQVPKVYRLQSCLYLFRKLKIRCNYR